ncbi:MAG: Do family serine endopeptidase [Candidatus Saccharibacteria bacterium]|nr:Do family serine endopeptidase [Rhodoferax sp.]
MTSKLLRPLGPFAFAAAFFALGVGGLMPIQAVFAQARALPDFVELVDQVGPSVVNIRTLEKISNRNVQGMPSDEDMLDLMRRFGFPVPNAPKQAPKRNRPPGDDEEVPKGVGSGFVLTADGFILTNAHVVEGADEVLVTLTDKREFKAKIIGADKRSDVAVVKIEAAGLPAVKVGDVNRVKAGEWVLAIGSPFGLENTVTAGIVSARQRDTGESVPYIQTDVAINPGNSGGPLINMRGEVIGINSQIYSRSGGYMGISFAIPMDEAIRVSEQLRTTGKVSRGRIGVSIGPVSKEVAESIGLGKSAGALVSAVESGSPAEKAGIEAGDIITRFDGKTIDKSADLPRIVGIIKPGSKSTVTVFRRGASKDLTIVVAELDVDKPAVKLTGRDEKPRTTSAGQNFGLTVSDLSEAQSKELKLKKGVRVDSATDAAARAGLREGDIIQTLANVEIASVKDFENVLAKFDKTKPLSVMIRRGDWAQFVVIRNQK